MATGQETVQQATMAAVQSFQSTGNYKVSYGKVMEFVPDSGMSWSTYIEKLEFYYKANGMIDENIKRAIFSTACGDYTYNALRSLVTPRKPKEVTFSEILGLLTEHFAPKPNEIVQRYKFYSRTQKPEESIASFVEDLRKQSEFCNFENLDKALRDRLVCGIREESIQRRLLSESVLTFQSALEIALAAETASKNVSHIRNEKVLYTATTRNEIKNKRQFDKQTKFVKPNDTNGNQSQVGLKCYRCTGPHKANVCKFAGTICNFCRVKGHIEVACFKKKKKNNFRPNSENGYSYNRKVEQKNHLLSEDIKADVAEYDIYYMDKKTYSGTEAVCVNVSLNGVDHKMEIDSGAARSIISEVVYNTLWEVKPSLCEEICQLKTWSKEMIKAVGTIQVMVKFKNKLRKLKLWVMEGDGPSLIGRDWFPELELYVGGLQTMEVGETSLNIKDFKILFSDSLGKYEGEPMTISTAKDVKPIFKKSRQIPFVLMEKVCEELDRLTVAGVIEPVAYSKWATPIVVLHKKDGRLRICGDYKCTVNLAIESDTYPLPTINESFASLAGGKVFTRLDLDQAYTQVRVDRNSADILTWNTPKGLFRVNRLPFGIKSAPGLFQRLMSTQLADIKGVVVLLDDILVTGNTIREHDDRVKEVLQRLEKAGLRLKADKCAFGVRSVTYLGYRVDEQGIHPTLEKVEAIIKAPEPTSKVQLQAFLGLYNFYERFLQGKAHILEPLHRLLDHGRPWSWGYAQKKAFEEAKKLITTDAVLVHYSLDRPLVLVCDASPYGVGAVLAHKMDDGTEKPIAFGSRTLQSHERNYAQIDKEALAIMFGVCKFRQYVYGRKISIMTDHKPLLGLLQAEKQTPAIMSPRMLRWATMLNAYDYKLEYRPGNQVQNADGLSRLPKETAEMVIPEPAEVLLLESPPDIPYDSVRIARETEKNALLKKVKMLIMTGWPEKVEDESLKTFWRKRNELSVHKDCILWGNRVVVPQSLQEGILKLLHAVHQGIVNTKAIARSYVWWPGMDVEIEKVVKLCEKCMLVQNNPKKEKATWQRPETPWSRVHVDFAGPFHGKVFLLGVDAYSGWPEIELVSTTSANAAIGKIRRMFATHGLPDTIVSDNGTAFTANEFTKFLEANGVKHLRSAPFHPASNGTAERMVQVLKKMLYRLEDGNWQTRLDRLLFAIRTTPRATTGKSPAEMLMNRQLKTHLNKLLPKDNNCELPKDTGGRRFGRNEPVYVRNYVQGGVKWVPGTVQRMDGKSHYNIQLQDGRLVNRHIDQVLGRMVEPMVPEEKRKEQVDVLPEVNQREVPPEQIRIELQDEKGSGQVKDIKAVDQEVPTVRRSTRIKRPPERLADCV